jgi:hypothetical protein
MSRNQTHRFFVKAAIEAVSAAKDGDRRNARDWGEIARMWWSLVLKARA